MIFCNVSRDRGRVRKRARRESKVYQSETSRLLFDLVDDRVEMLPHLRLVYKLTPVGLVEAFLDVSS